MLRIGAAEAHLTSIRYNASLKTNHFGVILKTNKSSNILEFSSSITKWDDTFYKNFPHIDKKKWYLVSDHLLNQRTGPQFCALLEGYETPDVPIVKKVVLKPSCYDSSLPAIDPLKPQFLWSLRNL